jgi:integrase
MFESILSKEMTSFLEIRKPAVAPNTFSQDKIVLIALDEHLTRNDYCKKELTEDVFDTWIPTLSGNKSKTVKNKVLSIRVFVKYLNNMGNPSFLPDVPTSKSDYIPYIYSDGELLLLIHYADNINMGIKAHNASSPHIALKIPMILRILYGCGTRLEETMALQRKDVDFKADTIFLRKTKYSKERRIPMHEMLSQILERYCLAIGIMHIPEAYLFPGKKPDTHLTTRQMATWFTELLRLANIDQRTKNPGERGASLHCLRHVFVLKSMQQLEAAGHSIDINDLLLPTYLGHETLLDTDKYMRFSGAQIPESLEAFESFTAGLIPKVEVPYEDE